MSPRGRNHLCGQLRTHQILTLALSLSQGVFFVGALHNDAHAPCAPRSDASNSDVHHPPRTLALAPLVDPRIPPRPLRQRPDRPVASDPARLAAGLLHGTDDLVLVSILQRRPSPTVLALVVEVARREWSQSGSGRLLQVGRSLHHRHSGTVDYLAALVAPRRSSRFAQSLAQAFLR